MGDAAHCAVHRPILPGRRKHHCTTARASARALCFPWLVISSPASPLPPRRESMPTTPPPSPPPPPVVPSAPRQLRPWPTLPSQTQTQIARLLGELLRRMEPRD